jgi:hypothetical protein
MKAIGLLGLTTALFFSSCFDVKEEIIVTPTGSGVYQITTDYTATLENMLSGPDSAGIIQEMEGKELAKKEKLQQIPGIHNVNFRRMPGDKTFRIGFEFNNIEALNKAVTDSGQSPRFHWSKGKLLVTGGLPSLVGSGSKSDSITDETRKMVMDLFQNAHYEMYILVPGKIKKYNNKAWKKPEKNTLMLQSSMADVLGEPPKNAISIQYK